MKVCAFSHINKKKKGPIEKAANKLKEDFKVNLVGNPNTGKTTLFNSLTASNEHVGNWHGVTVEEKQKNYSYNGKIIKLCDLPGLYSLTNLSFEEEVAADMVYKETTTKTINICDESNINRNLYLTLNLMELGVPVVLAVNKIDKSSNFSVDYKKMEKLLGISIVSINADKKKTLNSLNEKLFELKKTEYFLPYIKKLPLDKISRLTGIKDTYKLIKILEKDEKIIKDCKLTEDMINNLPDEGPMLVAKARFDYIDEICEKCVHKKSKEKVYGSSKVDKIIMNKYLAMPIFLLILTLVFYLTFFSLGAYLSELFSGFLSEFIGAPLISAIRGAFGDGWFVDLLDVGVIGGVGALLGFLPQIVLLFFFLSVLEDSGYLSRIAFCFEDIFGKVGLSGKSVYTLLMGFGCSTTAALTARNMEDKNSKIKTAMLTPYMSCSAKLPIYAVLGGAFFGASNVFYVLLMYLLGVMVAILLSMILEKTVLKSKAQSFILEFPPYRIPSAKRVALILWQNLKLFLIRIGSLIISMNIIIWILGSFSFTFAYVKNTGGASMLETLGKVFAPIFAPLGFNNWGLVSALFAGLVAKEIVVSSIAMFNGIAGEENTIAIMDSIKNETAAAHFMGPASALSYMVFCLLYSPCLATVSVLRKEIGKKWTFISIILQLIIAYVTAFIVFNLFNLCDKFGTGIVWGSILGILIIVLSLIYLFRKRKPCKTCLGCGRCNK